MCIHNVYCTDALTMIFLHDRITQGSVVIESISNIRGSCCDEGVWKFPSCGNWWYNCQEQGLRNMSTWVKFGRSGVTMPLTTEHLGRCSYSSSRRNCPLPSSCKAPKKNSIPSSVAEICFENQESDNYRSLTQ